MHMKTSRIPNFLRFGVRNNFSENLKYCVFCFSSFIFLLPLCSSFYSIYSGNTNSFSQQNFFLLASIIRCSSNRNARYNEHIKKLFSTHNLSNNKLIFPPTVNRNNQLMLQLKKKTLFSNYFCSLGNIAGTQKTAFLNKLAERKYYSYFCAPNFCAYASSTVKIKGKEKDSKFYSKMSLSKVPLATTIDPPTIPLLGCSIAKDLKIKVQSKESLADYSGDMIVFCVNSQKEEDAVGGSSSSSKKTKIVTLCDEAKSFDDKIADGILQDIINLVEFKASLGRSVATCVGKARSVKVVSAVGMGNIQELKAQNCMKVGGEIASLIKTNRPKNAAIVLHDTLTTREVQCVIESMILELNPDNRFKSTEDFITRIPPICDLVLFTTKENVNDLQTAMSEALVMAKAVFFAKELVHAPSNYCNTCSLANAAVEMATANGLKARILELADLEKLKMGCYLGVAKGSMYPPKFIHLTYTGEGPIKHKIALVGKGLCFDSGGYNIKSMASHMELMKIDMGGAAAVLGTALAISQLKPKHVEVEILVAAAENMVSAQAYRPGDVLVASNGRTVEIGNTDAEGRLTLADALVYAEKLGVDTIVDIATLTGACVVALGDKYAGVFSSSDQLAQELLACANKSGERMWHMPLVTEYHELLQSKIADMNNIGGGGKGGAITAAVFLKEFVDKASWAHIDIAGPAWNTKEGKPTGFGVRTLTEYIMKRATS